MFEFSKIDHSNNPFRWPIYDFQKMPFYNNLGLTHSMGHDGEDIIRMELWNGPFKWEQRHWSPSKALLLGLDVNTGSKTVNSILSSWQSMCGKLSFQVGKDFLLPHLSIHQLLCLLKFEIDLT